MERTWASPTAVTSDRIVEDILRFPKALDAVIAAKGAKVADVAGVKVRRAGRRRARTREYIPEPIAEVETLDAALFDKLDPMPKNKKSRSK